MNKNKWIVDWCISASNFGRDEFDDNDSALRAADEYKKRGAQVRCFKEEGKPHRTWSVEQGQVGKPHK